MFIVVLVMFLLDTAMWILNIHDAIHSVSWILNTNSALPLAERYNTIAQNPWPIAKFMFIPMVSSPIVSLTECP